jgi:hypothetical protein
MEASVEYAYLIRLNRMGFPMRRVLANWWFFSIDQGAQSRKLMTAAGEGADQMSPPAPSTLNWRRNARKIPYMGMRQPPGSPFWRTAGGLAALGFGAVAAFYTTRPSMTVNSPRRPAKLSIPSVT